MVMKTASQLFAATDRAMIEHAIAEAESKTAGEIVPVVATCSGRYDRAEDVVGLIVSVLLVTVAWLFLQRIEIPKEDWAVMHTVTLGLIPILFLIVLGFLGGALLATIFPILRLPFVPKSEMQFEVERAAGEAFQRFKVRGTAGKTGILIYVSLFERMVTVIGDDAIAKKVNPSEWGTIRDIIIQGLRNGDHAGGLSNGIHAAGKLLSKHFPIQPDDINELPNDLHLLD